MKLYLQIYAINNADDPLLRVNAIQSSLQSLLTISITTIDYLILIKNKICARDNFKSVRNCNARETSIQAFNRSDMEKNTQENKAAVLNTLRKFELENKPMPTASSKNVVVRYHIRISCEFQKGERSL